MSAVGAARIRSGRRENIGSNIGSIAGYKFQLYYRLANVASLRLKSYSCQFSRRRNSLPIFPNFVYVHYMCDLRNRFHRPITNDNQFARN